MSRIQILNEQNLDTLNISKNQNIDYKNGQNHWQNTFKTFSVFFLPYIIIYFPVLNFNCRA